jgi:hypothetical protein
MNDSINEIYKLSYTISNSRGKLRQNKINSAIINYLSSKEEFSNCTFKTEVKVESRWGRTKTFCIDVIVYDESGNVILLVLGKAAASNIKQNEINLINSKFAEIFRVKGKTKVLFVTFQPNITPFFQDGGEIKHYEENTVEFIPNDSELTFPRDFDEIYITFDIEGIENCKRRKDFEGVFACGNPIKNICIQENSYRKPKIVHE